MVLDSITAALTLEAPSDHLNIIRLTLSLRSWVMAPSSIHA